MGEIALMWCCNALKEVGEGVPTCRRESGGVGGVGEVGSNSSNDSGGCNDDGGRG